MLWRFTAADVKRSISRDGMGRTLQAEGFIREVTRLTGHFSYLVGAKWSCIEKLVMVAMEKMKHRCYEECMVELVDEIEWHTEERPCTKYDSYRKHSAEDVELPKANYLIPRCWCRRQVCRQPACDEEARQDQGAPL